MGAVIKRLLLIFALCSSALAQVGPTYVNSSQSGGNNTGSNTFALNYTSTAGNAVVAYVSFFGTGSTSMSLSDGSAMTPLTACPNPASSASGQWFYRASSAGGALTYTATFGASVSDRAIALFEYSYTGTFALDTQHCGTGTTTALSSGNVTTTTTHEVCDAGYISGTYISVSAAKINGTAAAHTVGTASTLQWEWDLTFGATFTGAATATGGTSSNYGVSLGCFKVTASAAAQNCTLALMGAGPC